MSPEERAAKLVEDIAALADFTCDGRVSEQSAEDAKQEVRNDIAAAIRAAENDALERTISKINSDWKDDEDDDGLTSTKNYCVNVIRALKHPEPTP